MTIERTAPIHELDRLLDAGPADPSLPAADEWAPTLGGLSVLDDAFAPGGNTLLELRRRLLADIDVAVGGVQVATERAASVAPSVLRPTANARPRWRRGRRADAAVAAAAMIVVAAGSVWVGRGDGGGTARPPSTVAHVGAPQMPGAPAAPETIDAVSPERSGVDAADIARASIGGFGSADLVALLAIEADAERPGLVGARERMLRKVDASWTDLLEGRGWDAVADAAGDHPATTDRPAPIGTG